MEFSSDSSRIIRNLMPSMKSACAYKTREDDSSFQSSLDNLLLLLYREIYGADRHIKNIMSKPDLATREFTPILSKEIITPSLSGERFYPRRIKENIDNTIKYQLVYTFHIGKRTIRVFFGIFTDEDIQNIEGFESHAKFIYSWLTICNNFSLERCAKTLDIFLYLTSHDKQLPKDRATVMSAEHINTAFTQQCQPSGLIVLYREEEWKKVFIHETFHTFGFDLPETMTEDIRKYVSKLFPVKSEFRIGEAYVETWARILYAAYASYESLTNKRNTASFILFMRFSLQIERLFSIKQMNKILHFMGLSYNDLIDHTNPDCTLRRGLYNEHTNVLAYYVLTALFMNDYYGFLLWCAKHNSVIFRFSPSIDTNKEFNAFIKYQYDNPSLLKAAEILGFKYKSKINNSSDKKYLARTTRMTAIEI